MYLVCALLNNAITCVCGNKTSEFFGLDPLHCSIILDELYQVNKAEVEAILD